MGTLKLVSKQVEVTQTEIMLQVGAATATNFQLHWAIKSEDGHAVKKGVLTLPVADIDLFTADPIDVDKVNPLIASTGAQLDSKQPLSDRAKFLAKHPHARAKTAEA